MKKIYEDISNILSEKKFVSAAEKQPVSSVKYKEVKSNKTVPRTAPSGPPDGLPKKLFKGTVKLTGRLATGLAMADFLGTHGELNVGQEDELKKRRESDPKYQQQKRELDKPKATSYKDTSGTTYDTEGNPMTSAQPKTQPSTVAPKRKVRTDTTPTRDVPAAKSDSSQQTTPATYWTAQKPEPAKTDEKPAAKVANDTDSKVSTEPAMKAPEPKDTTTGGAGSDIAKEYIKAATSSDNKADTKPLPSEEKPEEKSKRVRIIKPNNTSESSLLGRVRAIITNDVQVNEVVGVVTSASRLAPYAPSAVRFGYKLFRDMTKSKQEKGSEVAVVPKPAPAPAKPETVVTTKPAPAPAKPAPTRPSNVPAVRPVRPEPAPRPPAERPSTAPTTSPSTLPVPRPQPVTTPARVTPIKVEPAPTPARVTPIKVEPAPTKTDVVPVKQPEKTTAVTTKPSTSKQVTTQTQTQTATKTDTKTGGVMIPPPPPPPTQPVTSGSPGKRNWKWGPDPLIFKDGKKDDVPPEPPKPGPQPNAVVPPPPPPPKDEPPKPAPEPKPAPQPSNVVEPPKEAPKQTTPDCSTGECDPNLDVKAMYSKMARATSRGYKESKPKFSMEDTQMNINNKFNVSDDLYQSVMEVMTKSKKPGSVPGNQAERDLAAKHGDPDRITHGDILVARGVVKSNKPPMKEETEIEENKDTPGNSYEHQCAIHVKSESFGEGRTITTQHADPDENGNIAWYDVMFEHGIEKYVPTNELEILVSESHMHAKRKKKGM